VVEGIALPPSDCVTLAVTVSNTVWEGVWESANGVPDLVANEANGVPVFDTVWVVVTCVMVADGVDTMVAVRVGVA
jgi:hypothetical protein